MGHSVKDILQEIQDNKKQILSLQIKEFNLYNRLTLALDDELGNLMSPPTKNMNKETLPSQS